MYTQYDSSMTIQKCQRRVEIDGYLRPNTNVLDEDVSALVCIHGDVYPSGGPCQWNVSVYTLTRTSRSGNSTRRLAPLLVVSVTV